MSKKRRAPMRDYTWNTMIHGPKSGTVRARNMEQARRKAERELYRQDLDYEGGIDLNRSKNGAVEESE